MPTSPDTSSESDVIIIGGGIIGCSIALRLAQARLKVRVLDRGEPGAEATTAAAGMIAPQGEISDPDEFFELCAASRDLYPRFVAEIEELSGIGAGYRRDGTLLVAVGDEEGPGLEKIFASQTAKGLPIELLSGAAVRGRVSGLSHNIACGLYVAGDHWVDNEKLAQALVEACRRLGVQFSGGSGVTRINTRDGRVESVETGPTSGAGQSKISAGRYVLAAGCWSGELMVPLGISLPIDPCRGQMLEFEAPEELLLPVRAGHHYIVPRSGRRVLAGTTAEYVGLKKEVTAEGLRSIIQGILRFAPLLRDLRFRRAWAGLRPDTPDHLPVLGHGELENLVLATGHFRNGILLAPVTAQLISEVILTGSTSRSIEAYRPSRFAPGPLPGPPAQGGNS
ncbi:MAG TPA: glycine oxidase ThiO [Terriglobia bacterium]|nr:glycine oxidase ThiO [Terriglobia bacterium]